MEQEKKKKRAREEKDETHIESFDCNNKCNNAKKRDVYGMNIMKKDVEEEKECCSKAWDSKLALGVFDFPWLKDGVMPKSEDYLLGFEDNFSSSLEQEDASFKAVSIDIFKACDLCETPGASMAHIPAAKLEDNAWQPFENDMLELEAEDVDCIWSSLINQPL